MNRVVNLTYASSIEKLLETNSSFAHGVLKIAYAGDNRNGSSISREVFDRCAPTMRNCPIVCRYDRATGEIGGHDIEAVRDDDGSLRLVNLTQPIGCVPESANYWWETLTEDDGTEHEYICVDVLLWKRQEAYRKIRDNGITAQSMEITVKSGERTDDVFRINDFEFTAFTLLGKDEPCFEQASLEVFSQADFKKQLQEMMQELKDEISTVNTFSKVEDINNHNAEGGEAVLNDDMNKTIETTEDVEDKTTEANEPENSEQSEEFALSGNLTNEIERTFREYETISRPWGEEPRYWYVDHDTEANMAYAWDEKDWLLYGFAFTVNGDAVTIDWASKKRMKYIIAEFDDGEDQPSPFEQTAMAYANVVEEYEQFKQTAQSVQDQLDGMTEEVNDLRAFKANTEAEKAQAERDAVFARFTDLSGVEAFENLKQSCAEMSVSDVEEKCFALRGRLSTPATFSLEQKSPKLKIEKKNMNNDPYGGLFAEYGIESNQK